MLDAAQNKADVGLGRIAKGRVAVGQQRQREANVTTKVSAAMTRVAVMGR